MVLQAGSRRGRAQALLTLERGLRSRPGMFPALLSGALLGALNLGHCTTMCGPWLAASCAQRKGSSLWRYQIGRSASYTFAGALGGHLGAGLALTPSNAWTSALFSLVAAGSCMWLARSLWPAAGLVQVRRSAPRRWPSLFATLLRLVPQDAAVMGLLSALLPCGLLALALLGAVATGNASLGAAFMFGFVSVSGVALVGSSFALRRLPHAPASLRKVASLLLVAAALLLVVRPLASAASTTTSAAHAPHCH